MSDSRLRVVAIVIMAASVTAYEYGIGRVDSYLRQGRWEAFTQMADGTIASPYRYRVLVPYIVKPAVRIAGAWMPEETAFHRIDAIFDAAAITALLIALYLYLRIWFAHDPAVVGTLLTACTLPISLHHHFYAPYSLLEPTFLLATLMCVRSGRLAALAILTILASLNRETGVFLALAFLVYETQRRPRSGSRMAYGLVLLAISVTIFMALRSWLGDAPDSISVAAVWAANTTPTGIADGITYVMLFAGVSGWLLALGGLRRIPVFVRQMALLAVLYAVAFAVFGIWYEVRLLMPLYPFLVPAILASLYPYTDPDRGSSAPL